MGVTVPVPRSSSVRRTGGAMGDNKHNDDDDDDIPELRRVFFFSFNMFLLFFECRKCPFRP